MKRNKYGLLTRIWKFEVEEKRKSQKEEVWITYEYILNQ